MAPPKIQSKKPESRAKRKPLIVEQRTAALAKASPAAKKRKPLVVEQRVAIRAAAKRRAGEVFESDSKHGPSDMYPELVPLKNEVRVTLPTREAAAHLGRKSQTLRLWACHETGPIRPIRIGGRLAWKVADLRKLVRSAM